MIWKHMSDRHLLAIYRGGWKRCRFLFKHPRDMIALRAEVMRRGFKK